MRRRIRLMAPVLAIALIAGIAGCVGSAPAGPGAAGVAAVPASEQTPAPQPTPVVVPFDDRFDPTKYGTGGPNDMELLSGAVVEGLLAVRDYAPQAYPDLYTTVGSGTRGDPDVLRVYLTSLDPAVEADLLAVAKLPPEKVLFIQSQQSEAAGNAVLAEVTSRFESLQAEGVLLASWGLGLNGAEIGMFGHDPAQIQRLWDEFGPGVTIVIDTPPATAADSPACDPDSIDPGFVTGC